MYMGSDTSVQHRCSSLPSRRRLRSIRGHSPSRAATTHGSLNDALMGISSVSNTHVHKRRWFCPARSQDRVTLLEGVQALSGDYNGLRPFRASAHHTSMLLATRPVHLPMDSRIKRMRTFIFPLSTSRWPSVRFHVSCRSPLVPHK